MTSSTTTGNSTDTWNDWRAERNAAATAPHGLASVTGTHWLTEEPLTIESLPGRWSAIGGKVVGTADVTLAPGESQAIGDLSVSALARAGEVAIRVFDPKAPTRLALAGIDAFEPDPAWVIDGVLESREELTIEHIDGFVGAKDAVVLTAAIAGQERTLSAIATPDGNAQIVFADSTNGTETQRFRFLNVVLGEIGETVVIDFNRAFLPPCTFTDHYLCPLPPQNNWFDFPVKAGESRLVPTSD